MFILDIRQPDVYAKGHIKGAVNLPFGTAISDNLDKLPKDKPIMLYCYTGQTAGQAVALLNTAGFNVKSVNLGWDLGISKVDGVVDVTETKENILVVPANPAQIDPAVKDALTKYFAGLNDVKGTTYANYKISEDNAKKLLDSKDNTVIFLSIRSAKDYASGHIDSAVNIPFEKGMQSKFNTLPKDKKIIVYCYTGQTAGQTVAGLKLLGYDAVSLNAGMGTKATGTSGWTNKGFPVVK
jgi:rhodanese-related sulfurtransferase